MNAISAFKQTYTATLNRFSHVNTWLLFIKYIDYTAPESSSVNLPRDKPHNGVKTDP